MPEFAALAFDKGAEDADYDACMVGGTRPKKQRLRGTPTSILSAVAGKLCDGMHRHAPWKIDGKPQTAQEAAYPQEFCELVAAQLEPEGWPTEKDLEMVERIERTGAAIQSRTMPPIVAAARPAQAEANQARLKETAGTQPRSSRCKRLVAEYKNIEVIVTSPAEAELLEQVRANSKGWPEKDLQLEQGRIRKGQRVIAISQGGKKHDDSPQELVNVGGNKLVLGKLAPASGTTSSPSSPPSSAASQLEQRGRQEGGREAASETMLAQVATPWEPE